MILRHSFLGLLACLAALGVPATTAQAQETRQESPPEKQRDAVGPDESVEEILVQGTSVTGALDQTRFSESIMDVLSAEDFAVTGDSSVVDALARVTGVTVVDDKYIYVRGLGERYSSTLFNDASLPSPDPVRRVIPLDLFPSGVMEELTIQKTYAPYLPADFAGGSVQLTTRAIPAEREARLSLATEYNTETTGRSTTWYQGDDTDWTGFEGGLRDMPGIFDTLAVDGRVPGPNQLTDEQLRDLGLALNRTFDTENEALAPNFIMNGSWADNYRTPAGKFGFLVGGRAENKWQHTREERSTSDPYGNFVSKTIGPGQQRTVNDIGYSALGTMSWNPSDAHTVKATLFYTRATDKRYIDTDYQDREENRFRTTEAEWEVEQLVTGQLSGTHTFSGLRDLGVDWGLTYSQATRDKPDSFYYLYELIGADPVLTEYNGQDWEALTDSAWDLHASTELPVKLTDTITSTFKVGTKYFDKDRDSNLRRFILSPHFSAAEFERVTHLPIDEAFADENVGRRGWQLQETTTTTDNYRASERIVGAFVQADTDFDSRWQWMVGARYETSTQTIDYPDGSGSSSDVSDFFPATSLTWAFREDMQLRAAFSQTTNRPDLREIAEAPYINPEDRYTYFGNPDLKPAQIQNYDLRWEWYHGGNDNVEIAAFYKDFTDPIQQTTLTAGNRRTYDNAESATLYGVELTARQSLEPLGRWAEDFYTRLNGAYIESEAIENSENFQVTHEKHPLQGQSDWIANFQLTYDDLPRELQTTLAFNIAGPRITDVGYGGLPDAKEQPAGSLDFILKKVFSIWGQDIQITFKARNLLDPYYEVLRGDVPERRYRVGRTFSLEFA
ncbi:MAG: TonB-dependent receptor, partial [Deltaproteobacteria bacterium]|nr:TonB-dependent receptor [Deltaproteobacteria bacterium]